MNIGDTSVWWQEHLLEKHNLLRILCRGWGSSQST